MTEVIVWSGFVGGAAIGVLMLAQFVITGKLLGASAAYGNVCSLVSKSSYFSSGIYRNPTNWRLWFFIGIPLGGFLAALTSPGEVVVSFSVGEMYNSVLPEVAWAKGLVLGLGGVMIGYGSRMAGGCPSGHSISGMSLLNPPSLLASVGFFIGGIVMVQLLFNVL